MEKLRDILQKHGIRADKRFGQNFLSDSNLLDAIVRDALITEHSTVLEVGAGTGALTEALARVAKRVVSIEIDTRLESALKDVLSGFSNTKIIFGDVLRMSKADIESEIKGRFDVVANLPYYITSPLIFYFLENDFDLGSMTIMVQKEVADRLTARHNTEAYGALTAAVGLYAEAKIVRQVPRTMFFPQPDVDSAIVRLDMKNDSGIDRKKALRLIKCAFSMRRKTLVNNIMKDYSMQRQDCEKILTDLCIDEKARGESLSLEQLVAISQRL